MARYDLPSGAADQLDRLLSALEAEVDPPTTARSRADALRTHVEDSLSGIERLSGVERIADVGAGAGFPGLVLAIALPCARVDLIESGRRKTAVIDRLAQAAVIKNARSVTARAEEWAGVPAPIGGREAYEAVTARAVDRLAVLAEYACPLLRPGGVLVAWKGARDTSEEAQASVAAEQLGMSVEEVRRVQPFPAAEQRHLHILRKTGPTPAGIPRRPGMARKRPLG